MPPEPPRCRSVAADRLTPATEGAVVAEAEVTAVAAVPAVAVIAVAAVVAAVVAVASGAVLGIWGGLFEDVEGVDNRRPAAGEGSMACSRSNRRHRRALSP